MSFFALKERLNSLFTGAGETGYGWSSTAEDVAEGLNLSDRSILITGCNSGLGKETMRVLASNGATVLATARNREKARDASESVNGDTRPLVCDLANPQTIFDLVNDLKNGNEKLDAIIANAGIMALPELEHVHGYEKQFFVNYVGHFILVTELLEQLKDSGRVVTLSSAAHHYAPADGISFDNLTGEKGYGPWKAYGQSKLAMLLFARELSRRFQDDRLNRTAYAVHPGVIHTNLTRNMHYTVEYVMNVFSALYLKSIPQGAATQTFAAVHPDAEKYDGRYLADTNPRETSELGRDGELARKLWKQTESIVEEIRQ